MIFKTVDVSAIALVAAHYVLLHHAVKAGEDFRRFLFHTAPMVGRQSWRGYLKNTYWGKSSCQTSSVYDFILPNGDAE